MSDRNIYKWVSEWVNEWPTVVPLGDVRMEEIEELGEPICETPGRPVREDFSSTVCIERWKSGQE